MKGKVLAGAGIGVAALLIGGGTYAKTSLETIKAPNGKEVQKVAVEGEVTKNSENGKNHIELKEADGKTYEVHLGPKWYKDTSVNVGDKIKVEGVEKEEGEVGAWKLTKADGSEVVLRTKAGKPEWAGKGKGMGKNGNHDCQQKQMKAQNQNN